MSTVLLPGGMGRRRHVFLESFPEDRPPHVGVGADARVRLDGSGRDLCPFLELEIEAAIARREWLVRRLVWCLGRPG
jgi:hypothetical protein